MPTTADAAGLAARLRAAGCVFAEDEAALLLEAAGDDADLERLVAARVTGTPLEQVLGWAEFCGLRVVVRPGVFVPRRRTGLVVRLALGLLRPGDAVADLGCGSGAVAMALLDAEPSLDVHAVDVDQRAVACARVNLPPGRVHHGDLYDGLPRALRGRLAAVVANAPYVPTGAIATMPPEARDHEPRIALDGGPDGLDVQRRVVEGAAAWLAPGGCVVVETSRAQAAGTLAAMAGAGLTATVHHDDDQHAAGGTAVIGRVPGGAPPDTPGAV